MIEKFARVFLLDQRIYIVRQVESKQLDEVRISNVLVNHMEQNFDIHKNELFA